MALPQLTAQQRQAASAKATASRRERAEVKDQLKQSSLSVAEVLALGDRNEVIGAMRVIGNSERSVMRASLWCRAWVAGRSF